MKQIGVEPILPWLNTGWEGPGCGWEGPGCKVKVQWLNFGNTSVRLKRQETSLSDVPQ